MARESITLDLSKKEDLIIFNILFKMLKKGFSYSLNIPPDINSIVIADDGHGVSSTNSIDFHAEEGIFTDHKLRKILYLSAAPCFRVLRMNKRTISEDSGNSVLSYGKHEYFKSGDVATRRKMMSDYFSEVFFKGKSEFIDSLFTKESVKICTCSVIFSFSKIPNKEYICSIEKISASNDSYGIFRISYEGIPTVDFLVFFYRSNFTYLYRGCLSMCLANDVRTFIVGYDDAGSYNNSFLGKRKKKQYDKFLNFLSESVTGKINYLSLSSFNSKKKKLFDSMQIEDFDFSSDSFMDPFGCSYRGEFCTKLLNYGFFCLKTYTSSRNNTGESHILIVNKIIILIEKMFSKKSFL